MSEIRVKVPRKYRVFSIIQALAVFIIVVILAALLLSIESVGVSEVAIIIDPLAGAITGKVIGPRFFIKFPWQYVVKIKTSVESLDMWTDWKTGRTGEWPAVTALTKDGLEVHVDITVRWRVDPDKVIELYERYPDLQWETKTLAPLLRETIRNTIANYTAVDTIEKRAEISRIIVELYKTAVKNEKSLGGAIIIENIDLRNIDLPEKFKQAVEQKLAEQQMKLAAQYKKERMLIEANATAMQKILEAQGEARAKIIVANSTAQSLQLIMAIIGNNTDILKDYVTYTLIKDIVSSGGNVYVVIVGGGEGQATVVPIPMKEG